MVDPKREYMLEWSPLKMPDMSDCHGTRHLMSVVKKIYLFRVQNLVVQKLTPQAQHINPIPGHLLLLLICPAVKQVWKAAMTPIPSLAGSCLYKSYRH